MLVFVKEIIKAMDILKVVILKQTKEEIVIIV